MNTSETTPLIAAASSTTTATTTIQGTTTTAASSTQQPNNNNNDHDTVSNTIRHMGFGFCIGMTLSCILFVVFIFGYILSSSSSERYEQSPTDYTMKVTTPTNMGLDGASSSSSLSSFQFVATQFISFTINTMGGLQEHGECDEEHAVDQNGVCYLGDMHNITHDVEHRLNIVKYVVKRIKQDSFQESPDIDHMDNVLKIVSFPEFFWRGPNGAYTIDEINTLFIPFSHELRHLISDDFYNDFLFCFGTIVAARPASKNRNLRNSNTDTTSTTTKQLHATEMEYFNFAPISTGGMNHHSFIVMKQYISNADFLSRSATLPNPTEENVRDYAEFDTELQAYFEEQNNTTIVEDNVIVVDGIRIGIEICLDHRLGVLWNNLLSHHHGSKNLVDVLLITSAGMAIERGPNPVVPGGAVYLCDGSASSAACVRPPTADAIFRPNQVCRGDTNIIGLKHIPMGSPGYSSFVELSACWDMDEEHLLKGYYSLFQPQGCAFTLFTYGINVMDELKFYPPSIEIYPTIALPFR